MVRVVMLHLGVLELFVLFFHVSFVVLLYQLVLIFR